MKTISKLLVIGLVVMMVLAGSAPAAPQPAPAHQPTQPAQEQAQPEPAAATGKAQVMVHQPGIVRRVRRSRRAAAAG